MRRVKLEGADAVEVAPTADARPTILKYFAIGLAWLGVALGAVLFGAALWIRRTFGPISIDQMLMHLPGAGGGEVTGAETGYISSFVWQALVIPLSIILISAVAIHLGLRYLRRNYRRRRAAEPPRPRLIRRALPGLLAVGAFLLGGAVFAQSISLATYVASFATKLVIDDYYAAPMYEALATQPVLDVRASDAPLNVVTIYLESAESAFGDESVFGLNMYRPLEDATIDWLSVDHLTAYEGGGWTMAGIVGSECGIPLRGPGFGEIPGGEIGDGTDGYLSGISCVGDVLAEAGYTGVFLGGADEAFASKGNYLRSHGYSEVFDLNYWEAQGETERSFWGLSDRRLMENAKQAVTRLHDAGDPFFLTLLTVDAHEPATLFDGCPQQTEEPLGSVIFCSMAEVAGFIDYMEAQGYLEDTVVLVVGDHPKQFGEIGIYMEELSTLDERPLFNRLWVPNSDLSLKRGEIDQLSMAATLLDALGLGREDGRFGLGFSAFRAVDASSGAVALSPEDYLTVLTSRSVSFYAEAWSVNGKQLIQAIGED